MKWGGGGGGCYGPSSPSSTGQAASWPSKYVSNHTEVPVLKFSVECSVTIKEKTPAIREYGSTLYIGLSRFPHRANTNRFRCNSLASEHFRPKF